MDMMSQLSRPLTSLAGVSERLEVSPPAWPTRSILWVLRVRRTVVPGRHRKQSSSPTFSWSVGRAVCRLTAGVARPHAAGHSTKGSRCLTVVREPFAHLFMVTPTSRDGQGQRSRLGTDRMGSTTATTTGGTEASAAGTGVDGAEGVG
jgi:hypothetical protein